MANSFGGFVHTSPLSSFPHNPCITLASNCIRDFFGPTVQTVADSIQLCGGGCTLAQIVLSIRGECRRDWNEERERLVGRLFLRQEEDQNQYKAHRARGPEQAGFVVDVEPIRAALLVLIQHSLVHVAVKSASSTGKRKMHQGAATYQYTFDENKARLLPRYPRYVEYAKKTVDENGAAMVEELLVNGRMRAHEAIKGTLEALKHSKRDAASKNSDDDLLTGIVESFVRMVEGGYIEQVMPIAAGDGEEKQFEVSRRKKRKLESIAEVGAPSIPIDVDGPVSSLLLRYRKGFKMDAVWRVNIEMFHDSLRAFFLGRLVAERYGNKVQSAGSMVTASLRFSAHAEHAVKRDKDVFEDKGVFTPKEILPYLPAPVRKSLEERKGGAVSNLSKALLNLSHFSWPTVVVEVEEAEGHPEGGKFQVTTFELVKYLKGRVLHQVAFDRHGEVAARICSYLQTQGHQESDAIAEAAMVPAKDAREVLHRLYRANYTDLLSLQQSKQHNPDSDIYLWSADRSRLMKAVSRDVMTALFRIRLRRQHEMELGKDWIERAKEAGDTNENDYERDKANYSRFCKGLERLDNASLQLDETLMVLKDF